MTRAPLVWRFRHLLIGLGMVGSGCLSILGIMAVGWNMPWLGLLTIVGSCAGLVLAGGVAAWAHEFKRDADTTYRSLASRHAFLAENIMYDHLDDEIDGEEYHRRNREEEARFKSEAQPYATVLGFSI